MSRRSQETETLRERLRLCAAKKELQPAASIAPTGSPANVFASKAAYAAADGSLQDDVHNATSDEQETTLDQLLELLERDPGRDDSEALVLLRRVSERSQPNRMLEVQQLDKPEHSYSDGYEASKLLADEKEVQQ